MAKREVLANQQRGGVESENLVYLVLDPLEQAGQDGTILLAADDDHRAGGTRRTSQA